MNDNIEDRDLEADDNIEVKTLKDHIITPEMVAADYRHGKLNYGRYLEVMKLGRENRSPEKITAHIAEKERELIKALQSYGYILEQGFEIRKLLVSRVRAWLEFENKPDALEGIYSLMQRGFFEFDPKALNDDYLDLLIDNEVSPFDFNNPRFKALNLFAMMAFYRGSLSGLERSSAKKVSIPASYFDQDLKDLVKLLLPQGHSLEGNPDNLDFDSCLSRLVYLFTGILGRKKFARSAPELTEVCLNTVESKKAGLDEVNEARHLIRDMVLVFFKLDKLSETTYSSWGFDHPARKGFLPASDTYSQDKERIAVFNQIFEKSGLTRKAEGIPRPRMGKEDGRDQLIYSTEFQIDVDGFEVERNLLELNGRVRRIIEEIKSEGSK